MAHGSIPSSSASFRCVAQLAERVLWEHEASGSRPLTPTKNMSKQEQLGMNPGTAAHRLTRDLLFAFAIDAGHKCFRCGEDLSRETFSIEHKVPWLHSDDPRAMFFDLNNIAFSHNLCNSASRRITTKYSTEETKLEARRKQWRDSKRANYTAEKRAAKYAKMKY